ncbi:hypothetical protein [Flavobacterium sp.]|jgi:hypothetical protein|uniref:hypothetical protein n=1 Tax=Flavobacterium sp. TaxID=239 RepID=UPI0037C021CD
MKIKNESQNSILKKINMLTDEDFKILKKRYDKDFNKYWTHGNNKPKFNTISMNEFKQRLKHFSIDFFKKYGEI